MGTILYKDHVITTDATWDKLTHQYASLVRIVWQTEDGKREVRSFALPKQYPTFDEAYARALETAKAWADERLIYLGLDF
jgi:hypothetical protein